MPTITTDVLVIGAGPAGSVTALSLARNGIKVSFLDQHDFPRDKVCGDALIPDALHALDKLSLKQKVLGASRQIQKIRIFAPNRSFIDVHGEMASIPRKIFDHILQQEAINAGAIFYSPYKFDGLQEEQGVVTGAKATHLTSKSVTNFNAKIIVLATGASSSPLEISNMCIRKQPSGIAVRAYFKVKDETLAHNFDYLGISFDKNITPGYGWVFPGPNNIFNIGAGCFFDGRERLANNNVRELWELFTRSFPPARSIIDNSTQLTDLRGAPLRTGLVGSQLSREGLIVVGEAAGSTYSFSGEGIGKAMASGLVASEILTAYFDNQLSFSKLSEIYSQQIETKFRDRFIAYKKAQDWLAHPIFCNFLAWRANRGNFVTKQLEGMLTESTDPKVLFSFSGMAKSFVL